MGAETHDVLDERRAIGHEEALAEFRDGVGKAVEYAKALGCRQVNCLAGVVSERVGPYEADEVFVDNLRFAAA